MLYLNTDHLTRIQLAWPKIVSVLEEATRLHFQGQFEQPIKPYLNLGGQGRRIIAMPAYLGGKIDRAGLKWIASVPENLSQGIPRAHALTILNCSSTGRPLCIVNSTILSAVRTAGVSALLLREALGANVKSRMVVGLIGCGMIGRTHLSMLQALYSDYIGEVYAYDCRPEIVSQIGIDLNLAIKPCSSWSEVMKSADIVITATTSAQGYITAKPVAGCIILNVSLRDFAPDFRRFVDYVVVDSWDEVCRKNTDIERMHQQVGLEKRHTLSLTDVVCGKALRGRPSESIVMFNPMGMAIFDIALTSEYYNRARAERVGTFLN